MGSSKIITNNTKGKNYYYTTLSDIAEQNIEIPKMRIKTIDGIDYVEYFDKELNEWQQGAKVVIPEGFNGNSATLYGSALTYARKFTTLLAYGLCTKDDEDIENFEETFEPATDYQIKLIKEHSDLVVKELSKYKVKNQKDISLLTMTQASELCKLINKRTK